MNRNVLMRNSVIVLAIIFGMILTFGCDLVGTISSPPYRLTVRNKYNAPVSVEVGSEMVEIPAYGSHSFTISGSFSNRQQIWVEGKYFEYYSSQELLREGVMNYHDLEANVGWYGLANYSLSTIVFPKFSGNFFSYDEDGNYVSSINLLPKIPYFCNHELVSTPSLPRISRCLIVDSVIRVP